MSPWNETSQATPVLLWPSCLPPACNLRHHPGRQVAISATRAICELPRSSRTVIPLTRINARRHRLTLSPASTRAIPALIISPHIDKLRGTLKFQRPVRLIVSLKQHKTLFRQRRLYNLSKLDFRLTFSNGLFSYYFDIG